VSEGWQRGEQDLERAAAELAGRLPPALAPLARLAFDYRWSWWPGGPEIFRAVDPRRWELCGGNPVRLLEETPAATLARAARDSALLARATTVARAVAAERARPFAPGPVAADRPVAFLCAEYGIHGSLPIYAGGLGVLAGDLLKEASDRALPLVAVGLLYRQGSFHQRLDPSGWQHEYWVETDAERLPAARVTGRDGQPLRISVSLCGRRVTAQIWRIDVGRVPLFLLDSDVPENSRVDRWITSRLYVGDLETRLAQYALLGIGGIRALRALGIDPGVIHLNEGHAALAPLERAREQMAAGVDFATAWTEARARTVFTTHTPVAAGNDVYEPELALSVLRDFAAELSLDPEAFLAPGRVHPEDPHEPFAITVLGLHASRSANGVSRRHGQVSRSMWASLWPDRPIEEVPIGHVTNGVHVSSWMAPPMRELLDRYLGPQWRDRAAEASTWDAVDEIPDAELWEVRQTLRREMVRWVQQRSVDDRLARGAVPRQYAEAAALGFSPEILTVGFARRIATYKRLYLLLREPGRALPLLDGSTPLQLVIAGKAHPQDEEAKRLVQRLFPVAVARQVASRVAYLEDYDLAMAARLVAGCDVWVNLPRPPLEASGTSGMKAALNGGLHLSVLDGWWEEAFDGQNGWGIEGDPLPDGDMQDTRDASTLYSLLEREIVPTFYERDASGVPRAWVRRIKRSLRSIGPRFNAGRMLEEYANRMYRNH
jgi:starch phosphorylase